MPNWAGCAQSGVEVAISEYLLERSKCGLAGAVARRNVCHLVGVAQGGNNLLDLVVLGHYQVEPADDEVDSWVDRGRGCDDLVDARMRAAHHDNHAVGRVNGQR